MNADRRPERSLARAISTLEKVTESLIEMRPGALLRAERRLEGVAAALRTILDSTVPPQERAAIELAARELLCRLDAVLMLVGGLRRFCDEPMRDDFGGYTAEGECEHAPASGSVLFEL